MLFWCTTRTTVGMVGQRVKGGGTDQFDLSFMCEVGPGQGTNKMEAIDIQGYRSTSTGPQNELSLNLIYGQSWILLL